MTPKRVALVHYWLLKMRGGEKVLEQLCSIFPEADLVTHVYDRAELSDVIAGRRITESFISRLPAAKRLYKHYLPLMPLALESLDLSAYDLIISSEAGPAKGIIPSPHAAHICYCHSPMRYLWDQYHIYRAQAGLISRAMMPLLAHRLRAWDQSSAARVDQFIANSTYVAKRIWKYYRREAEIVHPPVDTHAFSGAWEREDFYLWAGELVPYKRADIAIDAFNESGKRLVIVGDGPSMGALKRRARPNITFVGRVAFEQLRRYFGTCNALVHPGAEDFGIIPVEVMAAGRPVIALKQGGAVDTVVDGVTGKFFDEQTGEGLNRAILEFEESGLADSCTEQCQDHAAKFSVESFRVAMSAAVQRTLAGSLNA